MKAGGKVSTRIDRETVEEVDLVEAMTRMGRRPPGKVDLVLIDDATGEKFFRAGVPMTAENRWAIWRAADGGGPR